MIEFKIETDELVDNYAQKIMLDAAKEQIANILDGVFCPVHGDYPKITLSFTDKENEDFEVDIDTCCEELNRIVNDKMSARDECTKCS